jgi:hypothetical protein
MAFPELAQLDRYRLRQDLTFAELAAAMERADLPIPAATLFYLLRRMPPGAHPTERTRHKIQTFLSKVRPRRRRRSSAAA